MNMNGINYSSLFANTNMFGQSKSIRDDMDSKLKGRLTSTGAKKTETKKAEQDTVEFNSSARQINKAGYDRPKRRVEQKAENQSVEESFQLSDKAQKLLDELKEKYDNMEFRVARWSTDEEENYYASKCEKDFSVLIDPDALEAMAADDEVRAQYESILENATKTSDTLREELGEDADKIQNFTVSIDRDGKVTYTLQLIEDFNKRNAENAAKQKEALENMREEKKEEIKKEAEKESARRISADSLEELIAKVKEKLS